MRELELKARIDDPDELRSRLREAGLTAGFRGEMLDRVYDRPARGGELGARREVLRVRVYRAGAGERTVLGWKGPTRVENGLKLREEEETEVADRAALEAILAALGYRVVKAIDREIEMYEGDAVSVRIERYPRLDLLAEVEGEPAAIEALLPRLGLPREAWVPHPLSWFVREWEARTGESALLARD